MCVCVCVKECVKGCVRASPCLHWHANGAYPGLLFLEIHSGKVRAGRKWASHYRVGDGIKRGCVLNAFHNATSDPVIVVQVVVIKQLSEAMAHR